jgi:hypothetical protein
LLDQSEKLHVRREQQRRNENGEAAGFYFRGQRAAQILFTELM